MKELIDKLAVHAGYLERYRSGDQRVMAGDIRAAIAALEAAEAREAELRAQMQEIVLMAARKHRPAYDEQQRVIMELRARVAELEQQCTKCGGNKVVSTTTNTFECLCFDPNRCTLCRGTGQYEVTTITECDQCTSPLAAPKEEV